MQDQPPPHRRYGPQDFDHHLALRMPVRMWLALLFLARPYLVLGMSLANRREPMSLIDALYGDRTILLLDALAALPALAVIGAWLLRRPGARALVRHTWNAGVVLFPLSALVATAVSAVLVVRGYPNDLDPWHVLQALLSIAILGYALLSGRVRDTFRDFPVPLPPEPPVPRRRRRARRLEDDPVAGGPDLPPRADRD